MIDHNFDKRITSTKIFYRYLSDLIENFKAIKKLLGFLEVKQINTIEGR